ncbi:hypothetical protein [Arthrobacter sp. MP_2.3]|uniref:hypothetical protein n=1 Tax=Arthrobacter sp. MP_2.3 TaxID=3349633 RepID=UPI0038D3AB89
MRKLAFVPALMAGTILLAGCAGEPASETASTAHAPETATADGGEARGEHSADDGHDHATEHYDGPNVTWDAAAEAKVKETAAKAMRLFGRPGVEEKKWFSELAPLLAPEYAEDAKYIDPARVPITTITDGPSISREAENPMTVTASFYTNDGPWDMMLHRTGQDAPWLVTSISSKASQ